MSLPAIEAIAASALPQATVSMPVQRGDNFSSMLLEGVARTDASIKQADQAVAAFATGDGAPPHQVMLALEEARMSLQMTLQIRSRLVEGYQELMRMQL